jgi:4-hydroxy-3-polyprenylbenzoate decarboxylase
MDGFSRVWPNPVVSSEETIHQIDAMWPELGLGHFLPSPSLVYFPLKRGETAVSD